MRHSYFPNYRSISFLFILILVSFIGNAQVSSSIKKRSGINVKPIPTKTIAEILKGKVNGPTPLDTPKYYSACYTNPMVSVLSVQTTGCCLYKLPFTLDLLTAKTIKAKIVDWDKKPVRSAYLYISDGASNQFYGTWVSDSSGDFTIDIPVNFKNLNIYVYQTGYENVGFDYKFKYTSYYLAQAYPYYRKINLRQSILYSDSNSVVFMIPSIDIKEKEQIVKDKFRFRDVKQLDTRYKDIYLRY